MIRRGVWPALVLAAIGARTAWLLAAAWPFTTDDAYIALRYARNLAEGNGIGFNPGEVPPTEGYSSFSFVVLGASALALGHDPVRWLKLVGAAALLLQHVVLYRVARRLLGPRMAVVPVLWLTALRPVVHWSASGLETAVYQLLCTSVALCWLRAHRYRPLSSDGAVDVSPEGSLATAGSLIDVRWLAAGMALACVAALTRPEGPLLVVALLAASLLELRRAGLLGGGARVRTGLRHLAPPLACFAVPYGVYFAWRIVHFGRLLPNSVLCKAGYPDDPLWLLRDFGSHAWPYLGLCLVGLASRRLDGRHLLLALPALLQALALIDVDPIIGHFMRHFLGVLALLMPLAALGLWRVAALPSRARGTTGVALVLCVAAWTSFAAWLQRPEIGGYAARYAERMQARADLGSWLETELGEGASVVMGDTGLAPYLTRACVVDALCLNSGAFTRPPIARDPRRFIAHVFRSPSAAPDAVVLSSRQRYVLDPPPEYPVFAQLAAHPVFRRYHHVATFGAPGDELAYLVYRLRPEPSPETGSDGSAP